MKTVTLSLRYNDQSLHKPVAWLVLGDEPGLWIKEIAQWKSPHQNLRLHPLPTSPTDRQPSAVLVTATNEILNVQSRRAIPYGQFARRLYVPVNASLEPAVIEAELGELLPSDNIYVFHPSLGLIGFEPNDALRIADLLKFGDSNDRDWNLAQPGVAISSRISAITPTAIPSLQEIIDGGRGDIGSESESLGELPPSPDEPKEGVIHDAGHKARRAIAKAVRWLTKQVPANADEPTWMNRLENWAERMLSRAKSEIERRREKEMNRLMHMLEQNPDEGLRHAIPMGDEAHRGLAPPSDRLGTHDVDFRLGQFGGGAAADYWDISWEMQQRLTQRYRELANRELNLGRHRRAAYIFAELLNDLHSAASALVNGRHWREAAVLYRDKLKNPSEAAKCLENGGLWDEAIELHKELGNLEKAGDLTLQLEQVEAAHDLYRQAVEKHEQSNDHINAARLLDEKLASPSEALTTLEGGWPYSSQAAQCLRQKFQLLARLGMHDESQKRVTLLRDEVLPENMRVVGVSVLAELASTCPEQSLRALSADSARVRASRELPNISGAYASLLVRAITGLEPHDRLLDRDGRRFLSLRAAEARAIQPTQARRPRQTGRSLTLVKSIVLPRTPELNYTHAVIQGDRVYAVGMDNGTPSFTRASLDSDVDNSIKTCPTSKQGTNPNSFVVFAVSYGPTMRMLYQPVGGGMLRDHTVFEGTDQFPDTVTVRGISQNDSILMGSCFSDGSKYVVLTMEQNGMVIKTLTEDGGIAGTFALVHPMFKSRTNLPVPMIKRRDDLFFAWNESLLSFSRGEILTAAQFDSPITNIAASSPHTRPRIAVTTENGASVYWRDFEGELTRPVETDLQVSQLAINSGGYLVLAGETSCEVFATQNRQLRFEAAAHYEDCEPIAVLPGPRTDQFAIVTSAGLIRFFELQ